MGGREHLSRWVKGQSSLLSTVGCWVKLLLQAKLEKGAFSTRAIRLESANHRPPSKWQDHGWTQLTWDWSSIVWSSHPMCSPHSTSRADRGWSAPVLHAYCSHHRCCATPSSGFAPVTISGATVAFGALFGYPLLPHQLWYTGLHPPQDAPIPGTLVACDWIGDTRTQD